jgi:ABC-type multidrug transport system ATPase subunit
MILKVKNLGKRYGNRWIFQGITFDLEQSQCLIVQGKNGSGKSTLLRLLAGLDRPTQGEIQWSHEDLRSQLSFCALDQATFSSLTVAEHLELAGSMRGISPDVESLIAKVGLGNHRNHAADQLSSGLRARLKIALAIQSNPSLLIWDEPGVALDDAGRALIELVVEEQKSRGALVIATNDPSERRFGTHAISFDSI